MNFFNLLFLRKYGNYHKTNWFESLFAKVAGAGRKLIAKLLKIKGNTIVWNQLVENGNFEDSTNWKAQSGGSTLSVSNGVATVTHVSGTISAYNPGLGFTTELKGILNHIYYVDIEGKFPVSAGIYFGGNTGVFLSTDFSMVADTWVEHKKIIKAIALTTAGGLFGYLGVNGAASVLSSGAEISFRKIQIIDLTAMFGSTKADEIYAMEQSQSGSGVAYFRSLFPLPYYQYDAGSLLSFNGTGIKTSNADETEESTTSIPISTYFPTGMKSAGSVYDELTNSKAITRIGEVDLGTLTWARGGTNTEGKYRFNATVQGMKYPSGSSETPNVISDKYVTLTGVNTYRCETCIGASDSVIFIYDESLSTVTASGFKTAMSNIYLQYELAEEQVVDITPPLNLSYQVWEGGTEQLLPINTDNPTTSPILADIKYPDGERDNQYFTYRQYLSNSMMMSMALNTIMGKNVEFNKEALDILMKGE